MKFKQYLNEKTFQITRDVNMLYDKGFKELVEILKEKDHEKLVNKLISFLGSLKLKPKTLYKTDSSTLKSKDAQAAHTVNPVDIYLGIYPNGSSYLPPSEAKAQNLSKAQFQVSVHYQALELLFKGMEGQLDPSELKRFRNEFTANRIKAAIAHELSHWANDSLHNYNIDNILKLARELLNAEIIKLNKANVNMTHFELDAQVHAIKQIKAQNRKAWDSYTLRDLFEIYTSLHSIALSLKHNKEILNIWQKALIKRLARENLLGKNMRNFVKPNEL